MNLDLEGRIAIVGGASQGIGYGIARALAQEGAAVAITARREADLQAAAMRLRADTGANVLPIQADCRRAEDCRPHFRRCQWKEYPQQKPERDFYGPPDLSGLLPES